MAGCGCRVGPTCIGLEADGMANVSSPLIAGADNRRVLFPMRLTRVEHRPFFSSAMTARTLGPPVRIGDL